MRLGYNSLCGFASVNHLHLHVFLLPYLLHIQHTGAVSVLAGPCHTLDDHYAPGFVFEMKTSCQNTKRGPIGGRLSTHSRQKMTSHECEEVVGEGKDVFDMTSRDCEEVVAGDVMKLVNYLIDNNIPHNVYIAWGKPLTQSANEITKDAKNSNPSINYSENADRSINYSQNADVSTHEYQTGYCEDESVSWSRFHEHAKEWNVVRVFVWARISTAGESRLDFIFHLMLKMVNR